MRFADPAWEANAERTGLWYEPEPWSVDDLVGWSAETLSGAVAALKRLYPPDKAKQIFQTQPRVADLLLNADPKAQDGLLSLGLDAECVQVWTYPELVGKLRRDDQFDGARFELALMAAMARERVAWKYEPFRPAPGAKHPNPDFSIDLEGESLVVDAKAAKRSNAAREFSAWQRLVFRGEDRSAPDPLSADLTFHESLVRQLQKMSQAERNELAHRIRTTIRRLHGEANFPSSVTVDDLVTISVDGREGLRSTGGEIDPDIEAERIVRGLVRDGAAQIPPGQSGCVIVRQTSIFEPALFKAVLREVGRWMREEGQDAAQLQHVLVVAFAFHEHRPLLHVMPISRKATPGSIIRFANALSRGLNEHACRSHGWPFESIPVFDEGAHLPGAEDQDFEL